MLLFRSQHNFLHLYQNCEEKRQDKFEISNIFETIMDITFSRCIKMCFYRNLMKNEACNYIVIMLMLVF